MTMTRRIGKEKGTEMRLLTRIAGETTPNLRKKWMMLRRTIAETHIPLGITDN
jgi:hypothetical protein